MITTEDQEPASGNAIDATEDWVAYISQRLNDAQDLLDGISVTIESVQPSGREHAADLIDSAIEDLQRLRRRFGPTEPDYGPGDPPF
ncbi:hypothetical protein [Brevibacterium spongiae]|uniref:SlyX family protein n=1 Tax=Brevibacterium spongiae TaxID=2909672 RepID=A0ABY5SKS2_9MICO|nr:hypothetical protein [Brevibacterium spongiae]UVI34752.1 hypothetical protein L1F31_11495 [Brevibacterium spongiae]UVI34760.1 hypothetical protein L1F31_11545 [Brevibacterium spongiae]UVI35167.1 hypothetical protein L1F31_13715 [Brevibacterium spongiae]UVI35420.1 hypothetical protein L1F31_15040 [Brevibacterium spongiae]UVI36125.1 hypothetical protein L1F31_00215 [Brevibacterium spongiae]